MIWAISQLYFVLRYLASAIYNLISFIDSQFERLLDITITTHYRWDKHDIK